MVTEAADNSSRTGHLFIEEWMQVRGLSDEKLAAALQVARETVTRWRSQQHRLNPEKIANLASVLGLQPQDLWRSPLPNRPSLDTLLKDAPDEVVQQTAEVALILMRGSR